MIITFVPNSDLRSDTCTSGTVVVRREESDSLYAIKKSKKGKKRQRLAQVRAFFKDLQLSLAEAGITLELRRVVREQPDGSGGRAGWPFLLAKEGDSNEPHILIQVCVETRLKDLLFDWQSSGNVALDLYGGCYSDTETGKLIQPDWAARLIMACARSTQLSFDCCENDDLEFRQLADALLELHSKLTELVCPESNEPVKQERPSFTVNDIVVCKPEHMWMTGNCRISGINSRMLTARITNDTGAFCDRVPFEHLELVKASRSQEQKQADFAAAFQPDNLDVSCEVADPHAVSQATSPQDQADHDIAAANDTIAVATQTENCKGTEDSHADNGAGAVPASCGGGEGVPSSLS